VFYFLLGFGYTLVIFFAFNIVRALLAKEDYERASYLGVAAFDGILGTIALFIAYGVLGVPQ
jgi:hypothetical protein